MIKFTHDMYKEKVALSFYLFILIYIKSCVKEKINFLVYIIEREFIENKNNF